ncbi:FAS1-like dehydratase domain-containing protein [Paracoccus aerodenitrificans]|uniref:FAS1-like dehydratase domain-containing protein n=1 Tax=Paracoccus aerodenitrificans TaxID=3017781 RepID=UPI0022F0CA5F|nr:MaoC family dehydratase N-terminal domain-containing protein [Paracoccus aerodenitrificans]WBU63480.1 MaoC family dehydratase N-terminal domain-containing protein [Paracoccus aerodenitrificans]
MLDIEHLRSWIGREDIASEQLTPAVAHRFNATFDRPERPDKGDAAPVLIHLCLAQPAAPTAELGEDGHPARGGFLPPVPLPRRMWAGGSFAFKGDIRVGEVVTRRSVIRDVTVKEGRSGTLCFVTVDHEIDSEGRSVLSERQDIVYRGADNASRPAKPTPEAPPGKFRQAVTPSPALLFRYSALTFNGHRIHYDSPYVRDIEHYPGLIVHGPMQATMLVHYAEKLKGSPLSEFRFRSLSPLFDDADFTLNAEETENGLRLWTSYENGPVAMEAQAT